MTFWQSFPVHLDSDKSLGNWISPDDGDQAVEEKNTCIYPNFKMYLSKLLNIFVHLDSDKSFGNWISADDGDQAEGKETTVFV